MSYNGSGTFNINSAGQPVVTGTVITSTAFNALTADLATGLSTALTKDGQTTPTANIPMGTYKITGLGAGTAATDAVRISQLQSGGTTTYITAAGTDTITGTVTPSLTAYATGQQFSFVVAATNTTSVTLNIDSVGAKAVTRTGSVALVAGDMVTGQVVIVEYDGTRFQLINGNSYTNLKASGTLGVTGATTLSSTLVVSGATISASNAVMTIGDVTRTASTSKTTGAIVCGGGLGVWSDVNIGGSLVINGSTSGVATISVPAVAGTPTITLPTTTGTVALTSQVIGISQTTSNLTASRALNTTYTNSTGKPIVVYCSVSNANASALMTNAIDGQTIYGSSDPSAGAYYSMTLVVPIGSTYLVNMNGTPTLQLWIETR